MERAVKTMNLIQVVVYLVDLIVFRKTVEEHKERLLRVLERLENCGLKMNVSPSGIKALCCQMTIRIPINRSSRLIDQLGALPDVIPALYVYPT